MPETEVAVITKVKINTDIKPPARYSVVYFNDEKTNVMFVIQSLIDVFNYDIENAAVMTKKIDEEGSAAVVSSLPKELAGHLRDLVIVKARAENYPLVVEIKEE